MGRVLVVDDDAGIRGLLRRALGRDGHDVLVAGSGVDGIRAATEADVDLVVLDLGLPDLDGGAVLSALEGGPRVMVLSADSGPDRRVDCFDRGAVDFVAKPFALRELLARVRMRAAEAAGQRSESWPGAMTVSVGSLVIDPRRFAATVDGESVDLSPREFRLLEYLVRQRPRVCTRDELLQEVWGYGTGQGASNVVDVTMRRLRAKLGKGDVIETVRHVGYCAG